MQHRNDTRRNGLPCVVFGGSGRCLRESVAMLAITKFLAGGVAIAALAGAAPAAAQYYPGYGSPYGYGYGGNVVGQVINQVLGGGYGYNGNGMNSQAAVSQCVGAVQARLNGGSVGYGYNGYASPYGGGYGNARVLGIS